MHTGRKLNEFEPVSTEAWRRLVEKDLGGADFERKLVREVSPGVRVQPLYTRADTTLGAEGLPGETPFVRGTDQTVRRVEMGWDVRVRESRADVREASAYLEEELTSGAGSVSVRLDASLRRGAGQSRGDGVIAGHIGAFEVLFEGINLAQVPISLEAGANALPAAGTLFALAERRGVPLPALTGWLYADPLAALLEEGNLPRALNDVFAELVSLALFCAQEAPGLRAVVVRTETAHDAGADPVEELAIAIATGIAYLRQLLEGGMEVNAAACQIGFDVCVGRDFFLEIAKLRAARKLWARVVEVAGGTADARAMQLHVRTSARTKTRRDPWVNLLRGTAESFAAAIGGADSVTTAPFDSTLGASDAFARRIARNTQLILQRESHLHRVLDPAGGSWYVEKLTDDIARRAWQRVQSIEGDGGIIEAVIRGTLQARLRHGAERDVADVSRRKLGIVGVSEFASVQEVAVARPAQDIARANATAEASALDADAAAIATSLEEVARRRQLVSSCIAAARAGAGIVQMSESLRRGHPAQAERLSSTPYAAVFEALRDRSDALAERRGRRPRVFLANLGPIAVHQARAGFAANLFEAGGFEVLSNDGFAEPSVAAVAFAASGAELVCICSSDEVYAEMAETTARLLAAHTPAAVVLAGKPASEPALRAAGVSDFIFAGCDAGELLDALLSTVGA